MLSEWAAAGLNVETAVKRGVYTVHESLVIKMSSYLSNRLSQFQIRNLVDESELKLSGNTEL